MNADGINDTSAQELLRAAERSLFDATVRLEEALAAMDGRRPADAQLVLDQARRWSELIAADLQRFSHESLAPAHHTAPSAVTAGRPASNAGNAPSHGRALYVPATTTIAKA